MKRIPREFINWAYFGRVRYLKKILNGELKHSELLLEAMRHTAVLATARIIGQGEVFVNAKIVGVGFIPKEEYINETISALKKHIERYSSLNAEDYMRKGVELLLRTLYFEDEKEAFKRIDFSKLATLEMASTIPHSSKHTWTNIRYNKRACLLFYQPPIISYELHGTLSIHVNDEYAELVNLIHDVAHKPRGEATRRPALIFTIKEMYDNSATPRGYGRRML